jgi:hypothetical protein
MCILQYKRDVIYYTVMYFTIDNLSRLPVKVHIQAIIRLTYTLSRTYEKKTPQNSPYTNPVKIMSFLLQIIRLVKNGQKFHKKCILKARVFRVRILTL